LLDDEENLWIGTEGNGLFVQKGFGPVKRFFRSGDTGSDDIKDIQADEKYLWLATTNGLLVIDRKTGSEAKRFDMNNGLPHNSINKIFIDEAGNICVATETDLLYRISRDFRIYRGEASMYGSTRNIILSISQNKSGSLWAASKGNGIFKFENDSVFAITRTDNLMSNYCYSILGDSEDEIWVGHDKGFSRLNAKTGVMKVFGTDLVKGGMCNPGAMFESSDKKVFIGTTEGLVIYDRTKDKVISVAPANNINYITIDNDRYEYGSSITRSYKRKSQVKISFTGINFSSPENVFYSTYLENYDVAWSKMNNLREVSYSLGYGHYKFNLISSDDHGHTQETPLSFELTIKHPFWKTWWFYILAIATVIGIVVFIIKQREKNQKKLQKYLEEELDARTAVIRHQKGEIELQNIEITDSINYAKRIQTSILPDISKLKEAFKDAYILFHPRDIVSGDFYWFDKIDEDRFMVVCADSTGHGVPGAFMSMIGSTLLQDIVTRQGITKPSVILKMLDRQIFTTLNQNAELGVANDGMDMVICEINVKTRHVVFASAMRPIIIVLSGEPFYIRGNRLSVGGESIFEKYFDDQEYYLNEGDTIYFFSDGLPDQFGGADGKKLKVARLKRLIEEMAKLPMPEQNEAMSKFFIDWKGSYDQVDDVIFMAVRV
jgi:serine phosphatase RsbU (regulator of sigma subunit)